MLIETTVGNGRTMEHVRLSHQRGRYMRSRIIATIGPASDNVNTLAEMIQAGMNIARLNYSHGDFDGKEQTIQNIRDAETKLECILVYSLICLDLNYDWDDSMVKSNCYGANLSIFIVDSKKGYHLKVRQFLERWSRPYQLNGAVYQKIFRQAIQFFFLTV